MTEVRKWNLSCGNCDKVALVECSINERHEEAIRILKLTNGSCFKSGRRCSITRVTPVMSRPVRIKPLHPIASAIAVIG